MYKKCEEILNKLESEGKIKISDYQFPPKQPLKLKLKDMLEENVDEKYYLSEKMIKYITADNEKWTGNNDKSLINKTVASAINTGEGSRRCDASNYISNSINDNFNLKEVVRKYGVFDTDKSKHQAGSVYDSNGISPTLDTMQGGYRQPCIEIKNNTKKGYLEAHEGDGINISSRMKYQRENVQKNTIQTLTIVQDKGVVVKEDKTFVEKHYDNFKNKNGYIPKMFNPYHESEIKEVAPTQTTQCGSAASSATVLKHEGLRIRKLTPLEVWRLMGFDDEDFEKAAFKKETSYIEGGSKCNAKLKIVNEKQRHLDMETYALCTTNDMLDMETPIQTKRKKSIDNENNEKMQNVNIAIEMLGEVEQKECVTNIIKCGENTTILYTLMGELDQHHMAIIELGKRDKASIGKYMKITLEENLNPMKLYIISTLIEQIIKSKIYTCIVQKANIQGNIAIIEDCVKNLKMMKLLNLKMEYTTRLNSDTMLYKQAGNSIVVNVLEAIFENLLQDYK